MRGTPFGCLSLFLLWWFMFLGLWLVSGLDADSANWTILISSIVAACLLWVIGSYLSILQRVRKANPRLDQLPGKEASCLARDRLMKFALLVSGKDLDLNWRIESGVEDENGKRGDCLPKECLDFAEDAYLGEMKKVAVEACSYLATTSTKGELIQVLEDFVLTVIEGDIPPKQRNQLVKTVGKALGLTEEESVSVESNILR